MTIKEITELPIRPSLAQVMMDFAHLLATRSTCQRLNVGCVITDLDMRVIYGMGYNGSFAGGPNHCDSPHESGKCGCVHSEVSGIINLNAPRNVDKLVFVTHLPCKMCAKSLINLGGVKKVYYARAYRDPSSLDLFAQVGVEVIVLGATNVNT